jgi:hypothetical protein
VANCCQQFREFLWQIAASNLESFCGKLLPAIYRIDSFCEQIAASNCRRQLLPAIVGSNLQNKLFSQIVASNCRLSICL